MKELNLTRGRVAFVDDDDFDRLSKFRWSVDGRGYVCRGQWIPGENTTRVLKLHREVMNPPKGQPVDHINGNTFDNRKANLRVCTWAENSANCKKKGPHRFRGVTKRGDAWMAQIKHLYKVYNLGTFKTIEQAAFAYDKRAAVLFGEFARLNFPIAHKFWLISEALRH